MTKEDKIYDETLEYCNKNNFKTSQKLELIHIRLNPELTLEEALLIYNKRNNIEK